MSSAIALYPNFWTEAEGTTWMPWDLGPITQNDLVKTNGPHVWIRGHRVHSLLFGDPDGLILARWDCINGFTDGPGYRREVDRTPRKSFSISTPQKEVKIETIHGHIHVTVNIDTGAKE